MNTRDIPLLGGSLNTFSFDSGLPFVFRGLGRGLLKY